MEISIERIKPIADGSMAELALRIVSGENMQQLRGVILSEMLTELSLPWSVEAPLAIERTHCDEILFCMKKTAAIRKGLSLLDYAQCTEKSMQNKLTKRGFPREIAEAAAEYLTQRGLINEQNDAEFLIETMAQRKLYGKSRIKKELYAKGFSAEVIGGAMAEAEYDFSEICAERIRRTVGLSVFSDRETRQKAVAALMRYGFSYEEIREAITLLQENQT